MNKTVEKSKDPFETIENLEIKLKHLRNDFELTRKENEQSTAKYLDVILELKEKNKQLQLLRDSLENRVEERTAQLQQTQKILQQKSKELQLMIDSCPAQIFYKDAGNRYIRVNMAFSEMTGIPIREIIGKTDMEIFGKEDVFHEEKAQSNGPLVNHEQVIETPAGTRFLLVTLIPYPDEDTEPGGIIGFALDITERRKLEEEQTKASKLESLGMLAGGIAHDFNNVLTAILGNISLGQTLVHKDEEIYRRLKEAENACLRARDLTYQLLTFSRGGSPVKKSSSIRELVEETARFALSGSIVSHQCSFKDNLWDVEIDDRLIREGVQNVIINAAQAMEEGGEIHISVSNYRADDKQILPLLAGPYVKITVRDSGHGIPERQVKKIFDPYFTTREQSSGLGATTTWSIIKRHGGHMHVESTEGEGTTIDIYLPAVVQEPAPPANGKTARSITGARILFMDDEEIIRKVAGNILEYLAHEVDFACEGAEALEIYKKAMKDKPYDLVILDLTIPGGMGGKKLVKELRKIDPELKAIVSSGYSNDPILANHRSYGFDGMVIKPYNVEQMKATIDKVLQSQSKKTTP